MKENEKTYFNVFIIRALNKLKTDSILSSKRMKNAFSP